MTRMTDGFDLIFLLFTYASRLLGLEPGTSNMYTRRRTLKHELQTLWVYLVKEQGL